MRPFLPILSRVAVLFIECLVRGYQVVLAPLLVGSCKFVPSCSEYFIRAVREWGPFRGTALGVRRLLRCHPFSPGGLDPVPQRTDRTARDGSEPQTMNVE